MYLRLWVMMFLQYFTWGCWWVTLGTYIMAHEKGSPGGFFSDGFTGSAISTQAIAAIIAPFVVGLIADRYFPTQIVLGVLHLAGAVILYFTSQIQDQTQFWIGLLVYFLTFMPTLALTNSLSMHNLRQPDREFPWIRVWGTIGWIAAGWFFTVYVLARGTSGESISEALSALQKSSLPMVFAAVSQVILGIYCFFLPHTPPPAKGQKITIGDVLGLDALKLMRETSFLVFVIGSFLICIPLQFYYGYTNPFLNGLGVENAVGKQTWGQMSEVIFMVLMPLFFVRLGVKAMLLVGMIAWVVRYFLFAYGDAGSRVWMLYLGLILHGICYDFFFVTGQIYVDRKAGPRFRSAAQGFITVVTLGFGFLIGGLVASYVERATGAGGAENWRQFWMIPAMFAGVVAILFALFFRDTSQAEDIREIDVT
jgi:nucleoside transporter